MTTHDRELDTLDPRPGPVGDGLGGMPRPDPSDLLRAGRQAEAAAVVGDDIERMREILRRMLLLRSGILTDLERWDEALADLDSALAVDPAGDDLVGVIGTRGWILCKLGRLPESLASLQAAVELDASCRPMARYDDDFANLQRDAALGPAFRALVGADD